jgi:hypothetical protein
MAVGVGQEACRSGANLVSRASSGAWLHWPSWWQKGSCPASRTRCRREGVETSALAGFWGGCRNAGQCPVMMTVFSAGTHSGVRAALTVVRATLTGVRAVLTVVRVALTGVRAVLTVVRAALTGVRAVLTVVRATLTGVRAVLPVVRATLTGVRVAVTGVRIALTESGPLEPSILTPEDHGTFSRLTSRRAASWKMTRAARLSRVRS